MMSALSVSCKRGYLSGNVRQKPILLLTIEQVSILQCNVFVCVCVCVWQCGSVCGSVAVW